MHEEKFPLELHRARAKVLELQKRNSIQRY